MIIFVSPNYGDQPDTDRLLAAAERRHFKVHKSYNTWKQENTKLDVYGIGVPYGEQAFCEFIAQEMRWNLYQNSIDWLSRLPHTFLKRQVRHLTMKDVISIEKENGSILDKRFIHPADEKSFVGSIWADRFPPIGDETPVNVSTFDRWMIKSRFIVLNGKVISECCYYAYNTFNKPSIWNTRININGTTPLDFVNALLDQVNAAPCVIDVGYLENAKGWAIVDTQPIWTAELYGCDEDKFLDALIHSVRKVG